MVQDYIRLGHGSGGVLTRQFIEGTLLRFFRSPRLAPLPDSAWLDLGGTELAFTTDSYVVDPLFFPGGDIGKLAVFGTVNDLAVVGALPRFVSCALIIEEGLPNADLDAILQSMQGAAEQAGVEVVTGDTKVLPRGKADGLFINTAGIGALPQGGRRPGGEMLPGDCLLVSGPVGDHGAAVLSRREGISLDVAVPSDCAPLTAVAQAVLGSAQRVPFLRDLTRGGLATILNEATAPGTPGIVLEEARTPVRDEVRALCEILGLDPLYLACEGRLVAVVDPDSRDAVIAAVRAAPGGDDACVAGCADGHYDGQVVLETVLGTRRLLPMLSGEQLPRIC